MVYTARLNWVIFLVPIGFTLLASYLYMAYPNISQPSMYLIGVGLLWIIMMYISYAFSLLMIKKKQVILRKGILVRKTIDIPMNKIESIDISQSILGSLFQYGTLVITGTGGTQQVISYINKPLTCRRMIEQQMHE